jgi:8-oxo-dGTP pyrophosphatase MutT (NUDIX family)
MTTPETNNINPNEPMLPLEGMPDPVSTPVEKDYVGFQDVLPVEIPGAMTPISTSPEAQAKRGWSVEINGEKVPNVSQVLLRNDKLGLTLEYGNTRAGYDSIQFTEAGGPVTVPYMQTPDGKLWIGVVQEERDNMGGPVWNVPRGMLDKHESMDEAAAREMKEETGHDIMSDLAGRVIRMATGQNSNSAITNTSQSKEQGATFFGVPVKMSELELSHDEDGHVFYMFPKHVRDQAEGDKAGERIMGSRFIPVEEALQSRDMYTSAGTAQLLVSLYHKNVPGISEESRQQLAEFNQRPDSAIR